MRRKLRARSLLVVPCAALVLGGCTHAISGKAVPASTASTDGHEQQVKASSDRTLTLGDLNAPNTAKSVGAAFDPCTTKIWTSMPKSVRPKEEDRDPYYVNMDGPKTSIVLCAFKNSGPVTFSKEKGVTDTSGQFAVYVAWGKRMNTLPKGKATKFSGTPGRIYRTKTEAAFDKSKLIPKCMARIKLSKGEAMVQVINSRFSADVCDLARSIIVYVEKLASK